MKRFSILKTGLKTCLPALFILALATAAFGQDPQNRQIQPGKHAKHAKLKQMDTNQDGQITRDEWKGKPKKFNKLDTNNDGRITTEEIKARHHKGQRPVK